MLHAVIMAGGSGTRFWPESRRARPKQFLTMTGDRSLLQQAVERCLPLATADRIRVVTNAAHVPETRRQLPQLPANRLLPEPCGRNTAPCLALAAMDALADDPDAVLLTAPADHIIGPDAAFHAAVQRAADWIARYPRSCVLFGIPPQFPSTGYGYIERGTDVSNGLFQVRSFREKPDRDTAETFLKSGSFLWNSGIFVWRADFVLQLLHEFQPVIHTRLEKLAAARRTPNWETALQIEFPGMTSISIDHGLIEPWFARKTAVAGEPTDGCFVLPATFDWDDVGSWPALSRWVAPDADGNTVVGKFSGLETHGCIIRSTPEHLVAAVGLKDFVVVHTPDATLIAPKDDEQALRRLIAQLEKSGHERFL